jgi:prevent-host-death family protein
MDEIGAFEAKNTLGTLLDRVEQGEEIVITRHGKAVARLVPNTRRADQDLARAALERIRGRAEQLRHGRRSPDRFEWAALKKLRDQGRP